MEIDASQSPEARRLANAEALLQMQQEIQQLAQRDREVKAHEQAHAAVGGVYASQPHYDYVKGPNGVRYATSGHVNIDVSPIEGDPQATLEKMQTVARAALAPAQPSSSDRAVAAKANRLSAEARSEMITQSEEVNELAKKPEIGSTSGAFLDLEI